MGAAMPFAWMPLMAVTLLGIPPEKLASASGIFNFARMLAASAGTAAGVTLWDQRSIYHRSRLAEDISPDSLPYLQASEMLNQVAPSDQGVLAALDIVVSIQARTLAMADVFYLGIVIVAGLILFTVLLPSRGEVGNK